MFFVCGSFGRAFEGCRDRTLRRGGPGAQHDQFPFFPRRRMTGTCARRAVGRHAVHAPTCAGLACHAAWTM